MYDSQLYFMHVMAGVQQGHGVHLRHARVPYVSLACDWATLGRLGYVDRRSVVLRACVVEYAVCGFACTVDCPGCLQRLGEVNIDSGQHLREVAPRITENLTVVRQLVTVANSSDSRHFGTSAHGELGHVFSQHQQQANIHCCIQSTAN